MFRELAAFLWYSSFQGGMEGEKEKERERGR